jgi:hypothetical protein
VGLIKNGLREGDGSYYYTDRSKIYGEWKNNQLLVNGTVHPTIDY